MLFARAGRISGWTMFLNRPWYGPNAYGRNGGNDLPILTHFAHL